jgi:hypothetical protein
MASPALSTSAPRSWILCPVYHDVEAFLQLRERLLEVVNKHLVLRSRTLRFYVVDDSGGLDPDVARLKQLADTTVIEPPFNLGHQRAIVYGLRRLATRVSEADVVITMDADGEDRPEDLPRLLAPLLGEGSERHRIALARRTRRRESAGFKVLYTGFRVLFRLLTGLSIRTGNYAAYRGWVLSHVLSHPYFDLCYSSSLVSLNLPIAYVPCERGQRYAGRSRMDYQRLVMHGLRMLMPFTDRIAIRALMALSGLLGAGLLLSLAMVAVRVFSKTAIPEWATSTLILVLSLCFIALGNFIVLFAVFSQSRSISLATLDEGGHGQDRAAASR